MTFRLLFMSLSLLVISPLTVSAAPVLPADLRDGLDAFRQASGVGVDLGDKRQQALYQDAEEARLNGRTDDAGRVLAGMKEGYWAAVGYLNLATGYAREDLNPARALVALRVALAMLEGDGNSARREQLRNRLLARAGYLAYQHGEYEKAISFLEKVALDSFSTPRALYLHGLALSQRGNHRAAMQSWHRAKKYPLAYPGVADAWIAMGRGYDLSGYLGQAGEAYLAANAAFESERVTLRKLAEKIRDQGAYKTLVEDARETGVNWFLADSRTLAQPRVAYLLGFMEQPAAQHAGGRVATLAALAARLVGYQRDLEVFDSVLAEQIGNIQPRTASEDTEGLSRQGAGLRARIERLSAEAVDSAQKNRLSSLAQTLEDTRDRLAGLDRQASGQPAVLRELRAQALALKSRNDALASSVKRLRLEAEKALDKLALDYVASRDQQMVFALDKTEQQIAHLYEYLALQNLANADLPADRAGEGRP
ncbi:hypothetical protein [Marinobacter sp. SS8-8]|uniref:hypothetical protein n=1 Tax=Marinobacter sp. SS8-8 TaxID=3050452 RepID=UPI0026E07180|nr:hypothetical protein [Marinobacter sp. SS8-8]|tara:strand:+ start:51228 stop:52670 length:1443 start_codon:yes stop_codon:yes gene_type:complete